MSTSIVTPDAVEMIEDVDGTYTVRAGAVILSGLTEEDARYHVAEVRAQLERQALVIGLRELADFLEANPDLPVRMAGATAYLKYAHPAVGGSEQRALLADVIGRLGTEPRLPQEAFATDVTVERRFHGDVYFRLVFDAEKVCAVGVEDGKVVRTLHPEVTGESGA
jgi:hypothetical protein